MEVNFLGVICLMRGAHVEERESTIKYFIVQVVGSCFLLVGILIISFHGFALMAEPCILMGIAIKLGIFPFHFWVPRVMSTLSWFSCFVVSIIQKISPLWLLSNLMLIRGTTRSIEMLAVLTSIVGCLGGLGVLNYRVLIAYSSLVHLGFLVILCLAEISLF